MRFRAFVSVLVLSALAGADDGAALKKTVEGYISRYVGAWKKLDPKAAGKIFKEFTLPEYVSTQVGTGQVTSRDEILATYSAQMKTFLKLPLYEAKVESVTMRPKVEKADVVLKFHVKAILPDSPAVHSHDKPGAAKPAGAAKTHTLEVWQTAKMVWHKTKSGWKAKSGATKQDKALLDGKPVGNG